MGHYLLLIYSPSLFHIISNSRQEEGIDMELRHMSSRYEPIHAHTWYLALRLL